MHTVRKKEIKKMSALTRGEKKDDNGYLQIQESLQPRDKCSLKNESD
jgi:hypothetical protein